ncbi:HD domain-containing protein [Bacillus sp. ISL-40]|uniref:HD domain-containing protein n=1 Tax=unclassified Bacillus (in: firmicutes) TaxID=185979 RepID=UPI001BE81332|nr:MULTISPECIES: HD domain-containing protein [unclassified Bacillus (in: firmicutes)]MBT2699331.1 HD domain-containing protein [Bacillus sp. ISL-40]MBT2723401.1 HD domain-containing protein [Bacillus sp. ISL-46]MBT2739809.1 HD domain-containing protein [Bacillus sp. ISL-77]
MKNPIIVLTEEFVRNELAEDATGHDWFHVDRVRRNALHICREEKTGEAFIIEMAALLHDIPDEKLNESIEKGEEKLETFLQTIPLTDNEKKHIKQIIATISYRGGINSELSTIEAQIVQDADRLDAIGAIGIARAFAYGGKKGQPIYNPGIKVRNEMSLEEYRKGKSTSIHHFYEKLLKLKDLLNTESAREMAESRQQMMETFLEQFYQEWDGQE